MLTEGEQNRLIQDHVDLVARIASDFRGRKGIPFEDIEAEGMLGLVRAARAWEGRAKFSTYATAMIRGTIQNFVRDWQDMEPFESAEDMDERVHEWQIWGGFPYEGWNVLPTAPDELMELYEEMGDRAEALENALKFLKPRTRRMITAHFLRDPARTLEQIARDEKISYYRCVEIIYDAMKALRENVLKQAARKSNVLSFPVSRGAARDNSRSPAGSAPAGKTRRGNLYAV